MDTIQTLLTAVTEYDRKQSTKRGFNPYALSHYCHAVRQVETYVVTGHSLRDAVITCFVGRLTDTLLRAVKLPVMTPDEAKHGLTHPLPELDDCDE